MTGRAKPRNVPPSSNPSTKGMSNFQKFRREQIRRLKSQEDTSILPSEPSALIKEARTRGVLNLSNKALSSVPESVWKINHPDSSRSRSVSLSMDRVAESNWWDEVDITKLILASNKLSDISGQIAFLVSLQVLDLHDNEISSLPPEVGSLGDLIKLNINHNRLSDLPHDLSVLSKLQTFSASHNSLKSFDRENFSQWDSLDELDLSHNALSNLNPHIGYLSQLTRLNMNHNSIPEVPSELSFLRRLTQVDLSHNQISHIGDVFSESSSLEQLYLQNNQIVDFPRLNGKLKELHLCHNRIGEMPSEDLKRLSGLVILDLKFNKIPSLPEEEISCLTSLERLDLGNNLLNDLPNTLGALPNLLSLIVEGNPIKTIRRDILNRGSIGLTKYLRSRLDPSLSASHGAPNPPPPAVIPDKFTMRKARSLSLTASSLSLLPEEAVKNAVEAKDILIIDLSKNAFSCFPMNLEPILMNITELNLSQNKLEALPQSLSEMAPNLEYVNLANNRLTDLTYYGSYLREINLSQNRFSGIPERLYACPRLEILILSENKLGTVPVDSLKKLKRLATLDISFNDIRIIPPELGNVRQIIHLHLSGNAFRVPRPEILAKGTPCIMAYLRGRIPG